MTASDATAVGMTGPRRTGNGVTALTVFLAPDGPADGVLDVLVDLSAAGLLELFLWVRQSQVAVLSGIEATAVDHGVRTPVALADWLLESFHDEIRLGVIVPLACGETAVDQRSEQRLLQMLRDGGASIVPVRCLVVRPGSVAEQAVVSRMGWHNVIVAPEEAYGPGTPRRSLEASDDPVEVGRHAAPVVAGLLGLWKGARGCPFGRPRYEGVRAVRAFYRRIDADAVEHELRELVLATGPLLPVPRGWGDPVVQLDAPDEACGEMAERLWQRHRHELVGPRERPTALPVVEMNWRTVLGWLLRFTWAALRNWPADWARAERTRAAVRNARRLQRIMLGDESAYRVVVRGVTKDDLPAGWQDYGAASTDLDGRLDAEGLTGQQPTVELTDLWADYRAGAFSLVDAGDRPGMPPRKLRDGRRAILRTADSCVPSPSARFAAVPGPVAARIGIRTVQAGDLLGATLLQERLDHLSRVEPMQGAAAAATRDEVNTWLSKHDRSYSVQVGRRIAGTLMQTLAEIRDYLRQLEQAATESEDPRPHGGRAVTIWTWVLAVLAVLGLIAGPVLRKLDVVNTWAAVIIAVVPVLLWLGFVVGAFVNRQRLFFQELNRRTQLLGEVEAAQANLRQAVIDLRRLQDAYEQYLVWSRVLGEVLYQPYGRSVSVQAVPPTISRGLPRTTRVAQAVSDPGELGSVAAALRADQYEMGWFGRLWDRHLEDAVGRLQRRELTERPEELIRLAGRRVVDTAFWAWAQLLERDGTSCAVGDEAWAARLRTLGAADQDLSSKLLSWVRPTSDGAAEPVPLSRFLSAVDRPAEAPGALEFTAGTFAASAQTDQVTNVEENFTQQQPEGLSRVLTLVQMGPVLQPWDFAVMARPDLHQPRVAPPPPLGPPDLSTQPEASPPVRGAPAVPQGPEGFS